MNEYTTTEGNIKATRTTRRKGADFRSLPVRFILLSMLEPAGPLLRNGGDGLPSRYHSASIRAHSYGWIEGAGEIREGGGGRRHVFP